ncbi:hypothetical protein J7643_17550 [bacterium]|nr:hypothetical protein [bacterium]
MTMMRYKSWAGIALSMALLTGCVAAPALIKTQMPTVVGETYAYNPNQPEYQEIIPVGKDVSIPQGKAAMTLFVVIPQKQPPKDERNSQYIEFSNIRRVDVTITGENIVHPVTTSINVSSGVSAAGTVVLPAGRNQIITAVGRDGNGNVISTVKGVATSIAGQVVNAEAKFGTTPLAEVMGALSPSVAPTVNMAAISGVINPILNPTTNNGVVTYATHPTFVNPTPIVNAINALITNGVQPGAITTGTILDQLGGAQPIYTPSMVTVRLLDPQGQVYPLPSTNAINANAEDRDGDGLADGSNFSSGRYYGYIGSITLSDPLSSENRYFDSGQSQTSIGNIAPGTYQLTYYSDRVSSKPWIVLPYQKTATVSVAAGSNQTVDIRLVDVSKPVSVEATGSFSSRADYGAYEWHRFSTAPNLVYRISYDATQSGWYGSPKTMMIFDQSGAQLFQSPGDATGSYTFASAASNSLYVYTFFGDTRVDVTTETLGASQSLYNTTIQYGQ